MSVDPSRDHVGADTTRAGGWETLRANLPAISVMLLAVCLQLLGAVRLKTIADNRLTWTAGLVALGVAGVVLLNLIRLGVWGYANSRFPLSTTFPLSSRSTSNAIWDREDHFADRRRLEELPGNHAPPRSRQARTSFSGSGGLPS